MSLCCLQPNLELGHPQPDPPDVPFEELPPGLVRPAGRELPLIPRQLGR